MTEKNSGLAVLFPGVGYTCTRPLLYFAGKLAEQEGYKVIPLSYSGFPKNIKGNKEKMRESFFLALEQTGQALDGIPMKDEKEILFISKSIGTVAAAAYAKEKGLDVRHVLFTPLRETFDFLEPGVSAIAFHGTADPWAATPVIREQCREKKIPLYITEGANHSLETGNVADDIQIVAEAMELWNDRKGPQGASRRFFYLSE